MSIIKVPILINLKKKKK